MPMAECECGKRAGDAHSSPVRPGARVIYVILFALGVAAFVGALRVDRWVWHSIRGAQTPMGLSLADTCSHYTQWQWLMLPCVLGGGIAWRFQREKLMRLVIVAMIAATVGGIAAASLRGLTGRVRPKVENVQSGWYGPWSQGRWVLADWEYNSFPSGHVTVAAALVAALCLRDRRIGLPLLPLPMAVGAARIYLGAHHLSDVIAGVVFGTLIAAWVSDQLSRRFPVAGK